MALSMSEKIIDTNRALNLSFTTGSFKEKVGFKIATQITRQQNKIQIHINTVPNNSVTTAPLETQALISDLQPGTYNLIFHFKNKSINGSLNITKDSYNLNLDNNPSIKINQTHLNKLPLDCIYGTIHYYSPQSLPLIYHFFNDLKSIGAKEQKFFPGNYRLFSINKSGYIDQYKDTGYPYTQYFIYQYNGQKQPLKALIKQYSFAYSMKFLITLRTSDGTLFNIWALGN